MDTSAVQPQIIDALEERLGITFKDSKHLELALLHSSYAKRKRLPFSNERLEFLGDSVFNMLIASHLYERFPTSDEGRLSKLKSMLVSKRSLLDLAKYLSLEEFVLFDDGSGNGKLEHAGREKESILADCAEAIIGAIYLDSGIKHCHELIIDKWISKKKRFILRDYKSRLQEIIQKKYKSIPEYRLTKSWGPEHEKTFQVDVVFRGKFLGRGIGKNKKEAEQSGAKEALAYLRQAQAK
ncbi:ribonuclease III [Elusimicrobiota bacterium]